MGVMTYGSLGGGILTGAFRELTTFAASDSRNRFYKHFQEPVFSRVQELLKVMDRFSADHGGVPLSQIALNWCAQKPFVSTCIVGAQHRAKVLENAAAFGWSLTADHGGVPLSQIALNWCAQKPFVSTCIVGAQHRAKVLENAAAFGWSLTDAEMSALDEAIREQLG